jgi:hypothetical protein
MASQTQPSKEQVREWLAHEVQAHHPPPTPERIREQLGWKLIEATRPAQSRLKLPCF